MKPATFVLLTLVYALQTASASAQTLRSEKIFPQEEQRAGELAAAFAGEGDDDDAGRTLLRSLADDGKQRDVLLLLPTIPVTFNTLQEDSTGEWRFGSAMTAGVGFTFVLGRATYNGNSATVNPWIIAGGAINAGIREASDRRVAETLSLSGFFGFGDVAVNFSWPLLSGERSIGLALKVDALTNMAPDAFMCLRGCGRQP